MNRQQILGPWKLISMTATSAEGHVNHPFGETPSGMILYDSSGYMSYTAMRPGRPRIASGDLVGGTPEEIRVMYEGFDAYCGTYELDLEREVVTHHIQTSKSPNWEGSDQVRYFQLLGDRLVIDTPPVLYQGTRWVIHVVFERPEGFPTASLVGTAAD